MENYMPSSTDVRRSRIAAIAERINPIDECWTENPERYALIERSVFDDSHYLTTHRSLEAAGSYHTSQEHAEDWTIDYAVDLDTAAEYDGEIGEIQWTERSS
jgi:hypothetical protein